MEDNTDAYYPDAKSVCKYFEIKNSRKYHDLYDQTDTLLLADLSENFRNMCLQIYELDPGKKNFSYCVSVTSSFKKILK